MNIQEYRRLQKRVKELENLFDPHKVIYGVTKDGKVAKINTNLVDNRFDIFDGAFVAFWQDEYPSLESL